MRKYFVGLYYYNTSNSWRTEVWIADSKEQVIEYAKTLYNCRLTGISEADDIPFGYTVRDISNKQ